MLASSQTRYAQYYFNINRKKKELPNCLVSSPHICVCNWSENTFEPIHRILLDSGGSQTEFSTSLYYRATS